MRERSLRELRRMAGWTQAKAARATGIDRAILSQIETGEVQAPAATVAKLRRALIRAITQRRAEMDAVLTETEKTSERLRSER
jgi:transcriptional regulator with XRE-family HTH domain